VTVAPITLGGSSRSGYQLERKTMRDTMISRVMTADEKAEHGRIEQEVLRASLALRRAGICDNEDLKVALARIEEWLGNNEGRWTK
jgi:hypothetical protein